MAPPFDNSPRIRGRALQARRLRVWTADPTCKRCGRLTRFPDGFELDHIVPLASAKTEEDVIRLNHFTNLRPMWAKDNIAKSDRITHLI